MLKQHPIENQKPPLMSRVLPVTSQADKATASAMATETKKVAPLSFFAVKPLYLSGWQILSAFIAPILYGLLLIAMPILPNAFRFSDAGVVLQVSVFLPLPVLLCVLLGYHLRSLRAAILGGAWIGFMFTGATLASLWLTQNWGNVYHLPLNRAQPELVESLVVTGFAMLIAILAAVHAQSKRGRRTMYDKDRNR